MRPASPGFNTTESPQITALSFDHTANLIWCGDSQGSTCSFTTSHDPLGFRHVPLYRYTKFRTSANNAPVIQHLNLQKGVLALLNACISYNTRRGLCNARITSDLVDDSSLLQNLTCMTLAYSTLGDLIVGGSLLLFKVDLNKPQILQPFEHEGNLSFINYQSKLLILGNSTGSLEIFDPNSNQLVKTFGGHNGLLSDLDVKGNYAATCGYLVRPKRFSHSVDYMVDPLVNIYDLRMMRALPPVPFPAGASFVKFHPKLPNIMLVASTTGQFQFIDMYDHLQVHLYQADLASSNSGSTGAPLSSYLSNLDISENGEFLCFSDGLRNMHLWSLGTSNSQNFVNFPTNLENPEVTMQPSSPNATKVDDPAPLNSIGMPYYKDFLSSNFPSDMVFTKEQLRLPSQIDQLLLELSNTTGKILPYDKQKYGPRYVVKEYESVQTSTHQKDNKKIPKPSLVPKFISERSMTSSPLLSNATLKGTEMDSPSSLSIPTFHDLNDNDNDNSANASFDGKGSSDTIFEHKSPVGNRVPSCYTRLEIHYSKFGVDDFDFDYYNQSGGLYAGLENHLDNSYVNPLLQIYRFTPIFYNTVTGSLLSEWLPNSSDAILKEANAQGSSILNELGYLFDMMHKAGSRNVSITNFSLILSESNIAKAHGLINKDDGKSLNAQETQQLIITFNKFLVESVINDYRNQFGVNLHDLTTMHYELEVMPTSGELFEKQYGNHATLDLITPPSNVLNKLNVLVNQNAIYQHPQHMNKKNHTLLTYLEYSLNQSKLLPPSANNPYPVEVKQTLLKLGPVLLINLPFTNQELATIKGCKKWLVPEFYTTTNSAAKKINFKPVITQFNQHAEKYELLGYVCEISHETGTALGQHNLVSYVKVRSPALHKDQWFLFNDFLVMPIPEEEVFNISYGWKKPVVLVYHNVEDSRNRTFSYFEQETFHKISRLNDSILYRDHFACEIREGCRREYQLLTKLQAPEFGSLVAIDAEFVSLRPEVVEVRYTGVRNLIRPTMLSLARISALRGDDGPDYGVPFIDDYIVHTKPIYDYLTTFSGIETGDLDPVRSTKTLVTLQTAYRRLWLLLNMGCVFVGHGLKSDFRCINLQVPRAQIRDTIDFYYLPDFRRKLSLKFLAYIVLHEAVQTDNHDSIEDANTALLLYKKYMELRASGEFEYTLRRIYSEGQQLRFRVPELNV